MLLKGKDVFDLVSFASKSIAYEQVKQLGSYIKEGLSPRLRYLDNVDALYFKEENSYGK